MKTRKARIALELPHDLNLFLERWAKAQLTNKSAVIRAILADWRKERTNQ